MVCCPKFTGQFAADPQYFWRAFGTKSPEAESSIDPNRTLHQGTHCFIVALVMYEIWAVLASEGIYRWVASTHLPYDS